MKITVTRTMTITREIDVPEGMDATLMETKFDMLCANRFGTGDLTLGDLEEFSDSSELRITAPVPF